MSKNIGRFFSFTTILSFTLKTCKTYTFSALTANSPSPSHHTPRAYSSPEISPASSALPGV